MKNDNDERLIEFLVTIAALIFFVLLGRYAMGGYTDEYSLKGDLASTPATTVAATTAMVKTDSSEEADADANLNSKGTMEVVDAKATAMAASVAAGAMLSQADDRVKKDEVTSSDTESVETTLTQEDARAKKDEVVNPDSETADKNVKKEDKKDTKIKEVKEKTEAEEEAGIIADIESEKLSSQPYILKGIYFETGSTVLTAKSKRQLDAIGKALKLHQNVIITLRGHADNMGSSKKNEALSIKRAASVGYALVERGANIDNIWTVGMGESEPLTSNGSAKDRSKNRRVDIAVTK